MSNEYSSVFFTQLCKLLKEFDVIDPIMTEKQLEEKIFNYLKEKGIEVERQVTSHKDRYDLICKSDGKRICLELKLKATISDIQQFDRYLRKFRDGFIIVCWQTTLSVKYIFSSVRKQSPIPIAMIEISKRYAF